MTVEGYRKFWGKYRGRVIDNLDPLGLGRVQVDVANVPGSKMNWALPCAPYGGPEVGFYAVPPTGAQVWVEYEGGDPNYPIWVGCFWGEGEVPLGEGIPSRKVFKTECITMILDDTPEEGGFTLICVPPAVNDTLTIKCDAEGIQILCPEASILMTPESITLTVPEAAISLTAETITATVPPSVVEINAASVDIEAPDISATAEAAVEITAGADVAVSAAGAVEITAGADAAFTAAGAIEISAAGDVSVEAIGACEMMAVGDVSILAADVNITCVACEITAPAILLTGLTEATPDLLIDGQQPIFI
jgi:Type VI secretion system/phage-baseplate injector OB domain